MRSQMDFKTVKKNSNKNARRKNVGEWNLGVGKGFSEHKNNGRIHKRKDNECDYTKILNFSML